MKYDKIIDMFSKDYQHLLNKLHANWVLLGRQDPNEEISALLDLTTTEYKSKTQHYRKLNYQALAEFFSTTKEEINQSHKAWASSDGKNKSLPPVTLNLGDNPEGVNPPDTEGLGEIQGKLEYLKLGLPPRATQKTSPIKPKSELELIRQDIRELKELILSLTKNEKLE